MERDPYDRPERDAHPGQSQQEGTEDQVEGARYQSVAKKKPSLKSREG